MSIASVTRRSQPVDGVLAHLVERVVHDRDSLSEALSTIDGPRARRSASCVPRAAAGRRAGSEKLNCLSDADLLKSSKAVAAASAGDLRPQDVTKRDGRADEVGDVNVSNALAGTRSAFLRMRLCGRWGDGGA